MAAVNGFIERHPPGAEAIDQLRPGDLVLTHRRGAIPRLIRLAQRRRFRGPDRAYAHWSHAALVVDGGGTIIEAEATGVRRSPLHRYRQAEYDLVRTGARLDAGAHAAVAYAEAQVGKAFGFLALFSVTFWLLTGIRLDLEREDHQICSGLVARALAEGGQRVEEDPSFMLPADLARLYGVRA